LIEENVTRRKICGTGIRKLGRKKENYIDLSVNALSLSP
jgi:hypothetical protein